jgi:uroporphyrin-III C-methyltransferase/precorrin-2 dehydrogenase/sirohydrochlorin ferrochelatase
VPKTTASIVLARKAASLRGVAAGIVPAGNRRRGFWQRFFFGDVRDAHDSGDAVAFELAVQDALFLEARPAEARVTYVLADSDPDLLTLKALRRLQEADVILHDGAAPKAVLEMARRDAVRQKLDSGEAVKRIKSGTGERLVRLLASNSRYAAPEKTALRHAGIAVESLGAAAVAAPAPETIVPFPVRDDLRDAILRAAS